MSWELLCETEEAGGLEFKKLRTFNISMLAKQAWRLVNNANPFVTSIMRARYFPKLNFLDAKSGANPSYAWRSILAAQGAVRNGCRRRIEDRKSTRIWKVPWLPCIDDGYLTTKMQALLKDATVCNLFDDSLQVRDEDVLNDICNERDKELIK